MLKKHHKIILGACILLALISLFTMLGIRKSKLKNLEAIDMLKEKPIELSTNTKATPQSTDESTPAEKKESTEDTHTESTTHDEQKNAPSPATAPSVPSKKSLPDIEKKFKIHWPKPPRLKKLKN